MGEEGLLLLLREERLLLLWELHYVGLAEVQEVLERLPLSGETSLQQTWILREEVSCPMDLSTAIEE